MCRWSPSRRTALRAGGSGLAVALAGCVSVGFFGDERPCGEAGRWEITFEESAFAYGANRGFQLTVDPSSVTFGDGIRFRLRNGTDETRRTGTERTYTIQQTHDGGWQTVFRDVNTQWDGKSDTHDPGEGFTWSFRVAPDGFGSTYEPCGPLDPGTYRFVYWSLPAADEDGPAGAVGVRFTITDE